MTDTSWLDIDLDALRHNAGILRAVLGAAPGPSETPTPGLCAVLKADGYGLGAQKLAPTLEHARVDMFAVYTLREAASLLFVTSRTPILVLMPTAGLEPLRDLRRSPGYERLRLTIHSREQLRELRAALDAGLPPVSVHLEVDTGMSRGGASPSDASMLVREIHSDPRVRLAGVFSHFACADCDPALTAAQGRRFDEWLSEVAPLLPAQCVVHLANSFGALRSSRHHRGMVRAGLALLGYAVEEFDDPATFQHRDAADALRPAVRWMSSVIHETRLEPGATVGYGAAWRATRPSRIGLVPVGYADGYPLSLSNRGVVRVRARSEWALAPVVGRVSMDQITVDLTDLPDDAPLVGASVEVLSDDRAAPNFLPTVAHTAGTITHELLCRLSPRVVRRHHRTAAEATGPRVVALGSVPRSSRPTAATGAGTTGV